MKALHAYIREHLADRVIEELQNAGCRKLSVLEVRGVAQDVAEDSTELSSALAQRVERVIKLEIVASDADVFRWKDVIIEAARTGRAGDGMVCVMPVESALAIRTSEGEG